MQLAMCLDSMVVAMMLKSSLFIHDNGKGVHGVY